MAVGLPSPADQQRARDMIVAATGDWHEFTARTADGTSIDLACSVVKLWDDTRIAIGIDVGARKQAEKRLQETMRQLRALSAAVTSAREAEAARIARELHDALGSTLTGIRWELEALEQQAAGGQHSEPATEWARRLRALIAQTDAAIADIRRISHELRPALLDGLGLCAAIEWHARQFSERTGITCRVRCADEGRSWPAHIAIVVFRIVQEALTNVARHAHATTVEVGLEWDADGCTVTIVDDGVGITEERQAEPGAVGLIGMRERAWLVGGLLEVRRGAPRGTSVTLRLPADGSAPPASMPR
jgi:signal transduction histidine kinase